MEEHTAQDVDGDHGSTTSAALDDSATHDDKLEPPGAPAATRVAKRTNDSPSAAAASNPNHRKKRVRPGTPTPVDDEELRVIQEKLKTGKCASCTPGKTVDTAHLQARCGR